MNKLLEYCKSNGYSLSLTNFLVDLFDNYSTNTSIAEQENFLNALINTKIVLVGSIEEFIITIKNKLYDEIGYEMSSGEELAMTYMYRQKGIYLPIPNIKSNSISRTIVVRVNKTGELICDEDNISLSHEIFHLLRSYGDSEIINSSSEVTLKSGVIVTKIPIIDGVLDYLNGTKQNVQCEENFVGFLGEKYNLISQMNIGAVFDRLQEIVNSGENFNSLSSNDKNEILTLYLNLLLLIKVYNGDIFNSLNSKNADFLEGIKILYGDQTKQLFQNIYSKRFYDESILIQLDKAFSAASVINDNEVKSGQVK
jgi:hypothetical protein